MKTRLRAGSIIILSFVLLSLVATYPAWLHLSEAVIGPPEDNQQNYWTIWWAQRALFQDHVVPWRCSLIYYPYVTSLGLHDVGLAYTLPGALLAQLIGSAAAAYNLLILLAFPLSAGAMYLLARDIGVSRAAAWVAGVAYAFAPYLPVHAQHHLQQTGIHWFPLLVLTLRRTRAGNPLKWPILAGLCFVSATYSSLYFAMFAMMVGFPILLWNMYADRRQLHVLVRRIAISAGISAVLLAPRGLLVLQATKEGGEYLLLGATEYCSDLLGLFLPPFTHPVWGEVFRSAQLSTTGSPWEFEYLGFLVIGLAVYGLFSKRRAVAIRWLLLAGDFTVLSLGPLLHLGGEVIAGRFLPYYWLIQRVPLLDGLRVPVRFVLLSSLCLAVAVAVGTEKLIGSLKWPAVGILAGCLIFVEFSQVPFDVTPLPAAPAHVAVSAQMTEGAAFLDVPVDEYFTRLDAQYCQTVHGRPIVAGAIGRDPGHAVVLLDSLPQSAARFIAVRPPERRSKALSPPSRLYGRLVDLGIEGVVLHRGRLPKASEEAILEYLRDFLGKPFYVDSLYVGWALGD